MSGVIAGDRLAHRDALPLPGIRSEAVVPPRRRCAINHFIAAFR